MKLSELAGQAGEDLTKRLHASEAERVRQVQPERDRQAEEFSRVIEQSPIRRPGLQLSAR